MSKEGSKIYHTLLADKQIENLVSLYEDGELDDETFMREVESLEVSLHDLVDDLCSYVDESKNSVLLVKERKVGLDKRKKSLESVIDKIRDVLTILSVKHGVHQKSGTLQIKTVGHTVSVSKTVNDLVVINNELESKLIQRLNLAISKKALLLKQAESKEVVLITKDEILEDSEYPNCMFDKTTFSLNINSLNFELLYKLLGYAQELGCWDNSTISVKLPIDADLVTLVEKAKDCSEKTIFDNPNETPLSDSDKETLLKLYDLQDKYKLTIRG